MGEQSSVIVFCNPIPCRFPGPVTQSFWNALEAFCPVICEVMFVILRTLSNHSLREHNFPTHNHSALQQTSFEVCSSSTHTGLYFQPISCCWDELFLKYTAILGTFPASGHFCKTRGTPSTDQPFSSSTSATETTFLGHLVSRTKGRCQNSPGDLSALGPHEVLHHPGTRHAALRQQHLHRGHPLLRVHPGPQQHRHGGRDTLRNKGWRRKCIGLCSSLPLTCQCEL